MKNKQVFEDLSVPNVWLWLCSPIQRLMPSPRLPFLSMWIVTHPSALVSIYLTLPVSSKYLSYLILFLRFSEFLILFFLSFHFLLLFVFFFFFFLLLKPPLKYLQVYEILQFYLYELVRISWNFWLHNP